MQKKLFCIIILFLSQVNYIVGQSKGNIVEGKFLHIKNDVFWNTENRQPIYSQGGGIFKFVDPKTQKEKFYWYGVHYKEAELYRHDSSVTYSDNHFESVTCYSSMDLVNWTFEGDVLTKKEGKYDKEPTWVGRLGIAYVRELNKYAMFVQHGSQVLITVSDTPAGEFKWYRQINMKNMIGTTNTGDQTVFIDEDTGKSYLIYSYGRGRNKIYVSEIGVKEGMIDLLDCTQIFHGEGREGNCMFKYKGKYYMCASNLYGWDSSYAYYLMADDTRGPYMPSNDMKIMDGCTADYAHVTQTGFFYTVRGSKEETVIYCGDRWANFAGNGLGYNQWCPLSFNGDTPYFNSLSSWHLNIETGEWRVADDNNYVKNGSFEADRKYIPSARKPVQEQLLGWTTTIIEGNQIAVGDSCSPVLNYMNSKDDRKVVVGEKSMNISDHIKFKRKVSQVITSSPYVPLQDGYYTLSAKIRNSNGFTKLEMYAVSNDKVYSYSIKEEQAAWTTIELKSVLVKDGKVEIGFVAEGNANAYCHIDDVALVKRGQHVYELSIPEVAKKIYNGHLKLGGTSPTGGSIEVNSFYMMENGKPVIPIMGEFHYSRYPVEQWEESILKMKAGGLTVIPTYVFWNVHEEKEGVFDWSRNKDLRKFIELCHKHDMSVIVRIGPFCHGEIRNGGLPDWLFAKPLEVRSNDANYLKYVGRLYKEIAARLKGLYYKDGGPVIGIQIENEHQHSAAPWAICYPGERKDFTSATYDSSITMVGVSAQEKKITTAELGELHMRTLKEMAEKEGMITPLYTATGWGNAAVIGNEAIPVTAAYTYPFWAEPFMSQFCLFKDIQRNPDYEPVRYDTEKYPSFCAEMGVGIQMIYARRPIVKAKAAEALMVRTLGSGANGIGYYMYHGGSTPKRSNNSGFFSDEPMGVPKISYDFQAPIGEFGLIRDSYQNLRVLHTFLKDFSSLLAPMETVLSEGYDRITPDNRETLRYAVRVKDNSGFIFMTNFQDHDTARIDQENIQFKLNLQSEKLMIPAKGTFTLKKDVSAILPFNLRMEDAVLKYATAQLLTKIEDNGFEHYFFFAPEGLTPEYSFDKSTLRSGKAFYTPMPGTKSTFTVTTKQGKKLKVTTLTREQALNTTKVNDHILITRATVLPEKDKCTLLSLGENRIDYILYPSHVGWKQQSAEVEAVHVTADWKKVGVRRMTVHVEQPSLPQVNEYFLRIHYVGDVAMAFMNDSMILDHFYYGAPWTIGLKRFQKELKEHDMNFYVRPLHKKASFLNDLPSEVIPDFTQQEEICNISHVEIVPEYKTTIRF